MTAQSTAHEFWNAMARSVPAQVTAINRWSKILSGYTDERSDEARAAIVADLNSQGVQTDVASLMAAYDDCIQNSLSFWGGSYLLHSSTDELLSLSISADALELGSVTRGVSLLRAEAGFQIADQTLTFSNSTISIRLEFGFQEPPDAEDPGALFDNCDGYFRVVKSGEIVLGNDVQAKLAVTGKDAVFTREGLASPTCGDPLQTWVGIYDCGFTDDTDDLGSIDIRSNEQDGTVQVLFNGQAVAKALLRNNALGFNVEQTGGICARLICDAGGARIIEGVLEAPDGSLRTFRGAASVRCSARSVRHGFSRTQTASQRAAPAGVCDIANDQVTALGDPQTFVTPVLSPLPVIYDDGSAGTIEVTLLRAEDVYRVPPGAFTVFRRGVGGGQSGGSDETLTVGWLVSKPIQLLDMVQPNAYQLRFTLKDWYSLDHAGLSITLHSDDPARPGLLKVGPPDARKCPAGTLGAMSPVTDFGFATAIISLTAPVETPQDLHCRLEVNGKNAAPDNCSRTRDGVMAVELRFLTASGEEKMPARRISVPILLDVTLACMRTEAFQVTPPEAIAPTGQGRKFSVKVKARGGMAPYRLRLIGADNPLNIQFVHDASPEPGVSQWTVSGVVPVDAPVGTQDIALCVQSDPDRSVSAGFVPLSVPVLQKGPPWAYGDYAEPVIERALLNHIYGQYLGSWAFFKWHVNLAGYGPLGPLNMPANQRAAARMTLMLIQPALAALGKPLETFVVSWYTTIEQYGRVGGLVDAMMSNLDSWKPLIAELRSKADQAWADGTNDELGLLTRAIAYAKWFAIDELLTLLNVESMTTHEEIAIYLAARNRALPRQ